MSNFSSSHDREHQEILNAIFGDRNTLISTLNSSFFDVSQMPAHLVTDAFIHEIADECTSRIIKLGLQYNHEASWLPETIIAKTSNAQFSESDFGSCEIQFYCQIAPKIPPGIVPHCFTTTMNPATNMWSILLEDLSGTHRIATEWPLPPNEGTCKRIVEALARFHALWWNHPQAQELVTASERKLLRYRRDFDQFLSKYPDILPRHKIEVFSWFFEFLSYSAAENLLAARPVTIVHGDAHAWNFFVPHASEGNVLIFDWDSWHAASGANDLANLVAMHFYPDRRMAVEADLLNHYLDVLKREGIQNYDFDEMQSDYKLAILNQMMIPIWQAVNGIPPEIWWNNLERILMAVSDLECQAYAERLLIR